MRIRHPEFLVRARILVFGTVYAVSLRQKDIKYKKEVNKDGNVGSCRVDYRFRSGRKYALL